MRVNRSVHFSAHGPTHWMHAFRRPVLWGNCPPWPEPRPGCPVLGHLAFPITQESPLDPLLKYLKKHVPTPTLDVVVAAPSTVLLEALPGNAWSIYSYPSHLNLHRAFQNLHHLNLCVTLSFTRLFELSFCHLIFQSKVKLK